MTMQKPNSTEAAQWYRARDYVESLCRLVALLRQQYNYAQILGDVARAHGVAVKVSDPSFMARAAQALETLDSIRYRLGNAIYAAESGELAARPTPDGTDLDIVAPEHLAAKWDPYKLNAGDVPTGELGIAPLIVLGIVVVVVIGGVCTVGHMANVYANKVTKDLQLAHHQAEQHFCADPNSATCLAWQSRQRDPDVQETRSAIDYLFGKGAGKSIAGGLSLGIGAALLIWALSKRSSK